MRTALDAAPAPALRPATHGELTLQFAADPDGRSYLARQFASYPFHVCRVQYLDSEEPGLATLYTQSCSGGLYEHDRHRLHLSAGRDSAVHLTSQASTIVHSMKGGHAEQAMLIVAEDNAFIEYLPDPQILFPEARLQSIVRVRLPASATVILSDAFLSHDPTGDGAPALFKSEILVEDPDGRTLAIDRLMLTAKDFAGRRPGVLGSFAVAGTLIILTRDPAAALIPSRVRGLGADHPHGIVGVTRLPNKAGYLCRALGKDGASLKRIMLAVWSAARQSLRGHPPAVRRK